MASNSRVAKLRRHSKMVWVSRTFPGILEEGILIKTGEFFTYRLQYGRIGEQKPDTASDKRRSKRLAAAALFQLRA